jgi:hypothetical protein
MPGNKKTTENNGLQIARLAKHLKSLIKRFENCPARATNDTNQYQKAFKSMISGFLFYFSLTQIVKFRVIENQQRAKKNRQKK